MVKEANAMDTQIHETGVAFLSALVSFLLFVCGVLSVESYELDFSTYMGGSRGEDTARAVAVDREGYIYVAGGTQSPDFPVTEGALDTKFATGGLSLGSLGAMDVFVTKLDPEGSIVWSTYLGGPNYDRAYSVEVDSNGCVYVAGRAGEGFPTTPGVVQEEFAGDSNPPGAYGKQDGFVTKLSADGSEILWSTYFGDSGGSIVRDIDIDNYGNAYITLMGVSVPSPYITSGAFQTGLSGGKDNVIAKLSSHGSHIIWASYLGGSGNDIAPSIRADADGYVYVDGSTTSADFPVTENAYQTVHAGSEDAFAAKFRPDGSGLEYATFLGGYQSDGATGKHGLAIDKAGHAYVVGFTSSPDFPVTKGAFQTQYAGGLEGNWEQTGDRFIAKISPDGRHLLASTFVGGNQRDGGEGIAVDDQGRVHLSTFTYSDDFPINDSATQRKKASGPDGAPFILAADFNYAELSTYMGPDGSFVIVGSTNSRNWPTRNAMQPTFGGGSGDIIVVKLSPGNP
jgi:beta-propeller repeat-containing protein